MAAASTPRTHIALPVADLDASVAFYTALLESAPTKRRPGYARFETDAPGLVLSLNARPDAAALVGTHFGIRYDDVPAVQREGARLEAAGLAVRREEATTCCYAVQDKAWATDPDGNAWEIYTVTDDTAEQYRSATTTCCATPATAPATDTSAAPARSCCG